MRSCLVSVLLVLALGLSGCGRNLSDLFKGQSEHSTQPNYPAPLDILIGVENTKAMDAYQPMVREGLRSLATTLKSAGSSFQIGLINTTENPDGNFDFRLQGNTKIVTSRMPDPGSSLADNHDSIVKLPKGERTQPLSQLESAAKDTRNQGMLIPGDNHLVVAIGLTDETVPAVTPDIIEHYFRFFSWMTPGARWNFVNVGKLGDGTVCGSPDQPMLDSMVGRTAGSRGPICYEFAGVLQRAALAMVQR